MSLTVRTLLPYAVLLIVGCARASDTPLALIDPQGSSKRTEIELGSAATQTSVFHSLRLHNPTDADAEIVRFRSSCECATILPEQLSVSSGGDASIDLSVDLAKEGSFVGRLAVEIDGYDSHEKIILSIVALLDVRPSNSGAEHAKAQ